MVEIGETRISLEITSYSPVASLIAVYCLMTIGMNIFVCYYIYRKRSLRTSCTALIVANLAAVDVLVSIKDLPLLISVTTSGRWYFEEHWCRSYGLTNVIYIIVSISTLVTITTEQYFRMTDAQKGIGGSPSRSIPLGYIIAHTTLSYSLSLLWSKYVFISRKAFCEVDWPPSGLSFTLVTSCIFLIPVSLLIYNFFGNEAEERIANEKAKLVKLENGDEESDEEKAHCRLQLAITVFLVTWSPYVIESFFTYSAQIPNIVGVVCAFIPIITTTLIPLWYIQWKKEADRLYPAVSHVQHC
mgnify:CR=1 FL=1